MSHPQQQRLAEGATALGLNLSAAQHAQLLAYLDLLAKWNKVYNLTAVRDPAEMLTHHLLDSLAVVAPLVRHTQGGAARVLECDGGEGFLLREGASVRRLSGAALGEELATWSR